VRKRKAFISQYFITVFYSNKVYHMHSKEIRNWCARCTRTK